MTIELNREAIAQVTALPAVTEAAEAGSALISLWPLTEAMQMDNDAKYAENLQVRVTRAFARVLTGEDVTVPDAEFVYEGADEIPGRPQNIVDTLLAANDAYDTMADYSESGDVQLIFDAAEALDVRWDTDVAAQVRETFAAVEAQIEDDAAQGRLSTSSEPADVATRFATALAMCDALLSVVTGDGEHDGDALLIRIRGIAFICIRNDVLHSGSNSDQIIMRGRLRLIDGDENALPLTELLTAQLLIQRVAQRQRIGFRGKMRLPETRRSKAGNSNGGTDVGLIQAQSRRR